MQFGPLVSPGKYPLLSPGKCNWDDASHLSAVGGGFDADRVRRLRVQPAPYGHTASSLALSGGFQLEFWPNFLATNLLSYRRPQLDEVGPFLTLVGSIADGYGALWWRAVGYRC